MCQTAHLWSDCGLEVALPHQCLWEWEQGLEKDTEMQQRGTGQEVEEKKQTKTRYGGR